MVRLKPIARFASAAGLLCGLVSSSGARGAELQPAPSAAKSDTVEAPDAQPADETKAGEKQPPPTRVAIRRVNLDRLGPANALARQWRPWLNVELAFVQRICPDLPPHGRVLVRAAAEQALYSAADAAAAFHRTANDGSTHEARIRNALSKSLRKTLRADQWEHFAAESAARVERRQAVVIRMVVQRIDDALYLTEAQRDQMSRLLTDRWQDGWEGWLQPLRGSQQMPSIPEDIVSTVLDRDQRQAWQKTPKVPMIQNSAHVDAGPGEDTAWWDEVISKENDTGADVPAP